MATDTPTPLPELTLDRLGELLTLAATEGLKVGSRGTEGDFTAEGIAARVLLDHARDLIDAPTPKPTHTHEGLDGSPQPCYCPPRPSVHTMRLGANGVGADHAARAASIRDLPYR